MIVRRTSSGMRFKRAMALTACLPGLRRRRFDSDRPSDRTSPQAFRKRGISCLVSPIPGHAFFEQTEFEGLLGHDSLSSWAWRLRSLTSLVVAARAVSPAGRRLPASRNSFDQL